MTSLYQIIQTPHKQFLLTHVACLRTEELAAALDINYQYAGMLLRRAQKRGLTMYHQTVKGSGYGKSVILVPPDERAFRLIHPRLDFDEEEFERIFLVDTNENIHPQILRAYCLDPLASRQPQLHSDDRRFHILNAGIDSIVYKDQNVGEHPSHTIQRVAAAGLLSEEEQKDLGYIITGDATIHYIMQERTYNLARAYVDSLYKQTISGRTCWPLDDAQIHKTNKDVVKEFIVAYNRYKQQTFGLIEVYRKNPRLLRGYIAIVGKFIEWLENSKTVPVWKTARKRLDEQIAEGKKPVMLHYGSHLQCIFDNEMLKTITAQYYQTQTWARQAQELLISKCERYAQRQGRRYRKGMPFEDSVQEANIGLIKAAESYDPLRGSFLTYAFHQTRVFIQRSRRNYSELIIPFYLSERRTYMAQIEKKLMQEYGRQPTNEEIAITLGQQTQWSSQTISQIMGTYINVFSLDMQVNNDNNGMNLHELIRDEHALTEEMLVEAISYNAFLAQISEILTEKECYLLVEHIVMGRTLTEIGEEFGLTRQRINQIEAIALRKLRRAKKGILQA